MADERIDSLYRAPLEEFTSRRNELAKELPEAKKLKKPTRAAWLVNQLAGRKPKQVEKLIAATDELRRVQEGLLSDPDKQGDLRKASEKRQKAIESLLGTAAALAREHKASSQILDRVEETLQSAVDPDVAEAIEAGRLEREQRRTSVGFGAGVAPRGAPRAKERSSRAAAAERRQEQTEERRRKEAERKVRAAEREVEKRRADVDRAHKRLSEAEQALRSAKRAAKD